MFESKHGGKWVAFAAILVAVTFSTEARAQSLRLKQLGCEQAASDLPTYGTDAYKVRYTSLGFKGTGGAGLFPIHKSCFVEAASLQSCADLNKLVGTQVTVVQHAPHLKPGSKYLVISTWGGSGCAQK